MNYSRIVQNGSARDEALNRRNLAVRDGLGMGPKPEPSLQSVIETAAECYAIAQQCEQQAATFNTDRARQILLDVGAKWRGLGDELKARASRPFSTPS
jgi:hypothetical protein